MKAKQNFEGHFYFHLELFSICRKERFSKMSARELLMNSFPLINNIFHTLHVTHNVFRDRNIHVHIV